jgi:hypothetical protein
MNFSPVFFLKRTPGPLITAPLNMFKGTFSPLDESWMKASPQFSVCMRVAQMNVL